MPRTQCATPWRAAAGVFLAALLALGPNARASDLQAQGTSFNSGAVAARLTVGVCTAGDTVVPDGPLAKDPGVEPCGKLTANDVDIATGSTVHFRAGTAMEFGSGFSVAAGALFTAELGATMAGPAFVRDESPAAVTDYYARFYINPDNLALDDDADQFDHLVAYDALGSPEFLVGVTFEFSAGETRLFVSAFENGGATRTSKDVCEPVLDSGWQRIDAHFTASTGTDGDVELSIDGGAPLSLAACLGLAGGLDNSSGEISAVEWGALNAAAGYLGAMGLDDFDSRAGAFLSTNPDRLQPANPMTTGGTQSTDFGSALGLDGDVLVVGSPDEDTATGGDVGAAYVFERDGFAWMEKQRITAPTEIAFELFGYSVDVALGDSGTDFLIVGAPGFDQSRGRAYIYERLGGGVWTWKATLTQDTPILGDRFGEDVAIDFFQPPNDPTPPSPDFFAAVGALNNDETGSGAGSNHGSVSIFQRTGGPPTWVSPGQEFFGEFADQLGAAVAMGGPEIIVGAEGEDAAGANAGGARQYTQGFLAGASYNYAGGRTLLPSDDPAQPAGTSEMGTVAAADYDPTTLGTAVLGAWGHDGGALNTGKVYIYDLTLVGDPLTETASLQAPGTPVGALFGRSVALSGTVLAVGAPGVGTDGTVFLYDQGATKATWNPAGQLTVPVAPPVGACMGGRAVGLSGLTAAVGCPSTAGIANESVFMYFGNAIFADGFESGDVSAWTSSTP